MPDWNWGSHSVWVRSIYQKDFLGLQMHKARLIRKSILPANIPDSLEPETIFHFWPDITNLSAASQSKKKSTYQKIQLMKMLK